MRRIGMMLLSVVMLVLGCSPKRAVEQQPHEGVIVPASPGSGLGSVSGKSEALACCKDYDELKRLDGKRVAVTGTYMTTWVVKTDMRDAGRDEEDERSRNVQIVTTSGIDPMLEIYHSKKGERPEAEIARFKGKKVRVVGTVHQRTPSQSEDSTVMQTMTGPYVGEIEAIEAVP